MTIMQERREARRNKKRNKAVLPTENVVDSVKSEKESNSVAMDAVNTSLISGDVNLNVNVGGNRARGAVSEDDETRNIDVDEVDDEEVELSVSSQEEDETKEEEEFKISDIPHLQAENVPIDMKNISTDKSYHSSFTQSKELRGSIDGGPFTQEEEDVVARYTIPKKESKRLSHDDAGDQIPSTRLKSNMFRPKESRDISEVFTPRWIYILY